jgi:hypothetical protein
MNFIPNAGATLFKSLAFWGAVAVSVVTLLINGINTPNAPAWVAHLHPADIKQTWDWLVVAVGPAVVALGRVIQQNLPTP